MDRLHRLPPPYFVLNAVVTVLAASHPIVMPLAAAGEKCLGEPPVQQYLWSGKTRLNAAVPISTLDSTATTYLGDTKRQQWAHVTDNDRYTTTAQVSERLPPFCAHGEKCCSTG